MIRRFINWINEERIIRGMGNEAYEIGNTLDRVEKEFKEEQYAMRLSFAALMKRAGL